PAPRRGRAGSRGCRRAALLCPGLRRVPFAGPRREHEENPRVILGAHLVPLLGRRERESAWPGLERFATRILDLDPSVDDDDPGALVHLVILQLLTGGEVDEDRSALL